MGGSPGRIDFGPESIKSSTKFQGLRGLVEIQILAWGGDRQLVLGGPCLEGWPVLAAA